MAVDLNAATPYALSITLNAVQCYMAPANCRLALSATGEVQALFANRAEADVALDAAGAGFEVVEVASGDGYSVADLL